MCYIFLCTIHFFSSWSLLCMCSLIRSGNRVFLERQPIPIFFFFCTILRACVRDGIVHAVPSKLGFPVHTRKREREREREREKNFFSRNTMELLGPKPHNSRLGNCLPVSIRLSDEEKKKKKKKVESLGVRLSTFASFAIHTQKRRRRGKMLTETRSRDQQTNQWRYIFIYIRALYIYTHHRDLAMEGYWSTESAATALLRTLLQQASKKYTSVRIESSGLFYFLSPGQRIPTKQNLPLTCDLDISL